MQKKAFFALFCLTLALAVAGPLRAAENQAPESSFVINPILQAQEPLDSSLLYDQHFPLEVEMELKKETDIYKEYYLTYTSVNDQRIPTLYFVPKGEGPFPAMLFMNGKGGSKEAILPYVDMLLAEGIAVLAPEPQYHGDRRKPGRQLIGKNVFASAQAIRQTIIDFRRGLDFLETRPEINQDAILYMGGSMGGILGTVICAVDKRIDAAALTVAGGPWSKLSQTTLDSDAVELNEFRKAHNLTWDDIQKVFDPVDPVNYIAEIAPRPLLMINGKHDVLVPMAAAKNLHKRVGENAEIHWVDYGHILPYDKLLPDILKWYRKVVPAMGK